MRDNGRIATTIDIAGMIKHAAADLAFDLCGIAPVRDFDELAYFPDWISAGHAGEMRYLESRDEHGEFKRASLGHVAPWARSIIVCGMNYNTAQPYSTETLSSKGPVEERQPQPDAALPTGWISRYAWGQRDYHDVLLERLRALEAKLHEAAATRDLRTWCYVDTGPLVERIYARYAGVGWIGKNTCIINQQLGSWLFLGVMLTSLELTPDLPAADRCGTCTRCLDACPTDAFVGPRQLNASRCISYLTIEKRGAVPEDLRAGIGRNVFGCDICQDVCPWNRSSPISTSEDFKPRPGLVNPDLRWLATLSEEDFRQAFRNSPIKRAKRTGLRRNAVIAIGNSGDRRFLPLLRELADDPDDVVAEHARWAIERLAGGGAK